jgi:hypothetical protein
MSRRGGARLARPLPRLGPASAPPRPAPSQASPPWRSPCAPARSPWRGGAWLARLPASPASGAHPWWRGPCALAPPPSPLLPRVHLAGAARRGVPATASARPCAQPWRLTRPWSARPQPCARLGVAAQLACPQLSHGAPPRPAPPARRPACPRLGATLRPPYPPRRRGLPVRDRDPTRPTPDVLRSPARHGLLAWLGRDVTAWRAPWHPSSLAAARTTCSWRPRSCVRQWSAAPFAHSRSLLARTTLNHHA